MVLLIYAVLLIIGVVALFRIFPAGQGNPFVALFILGSLLLIGTPLSIILVRIARNNWELARQHREARVAKQRARQESPSAMHERMPTAYRDPQIDELLNEGKLKQVESLARERMLAAHEMGHRTMKDLYRRYLDLLARR
ncbi:hypothetical protein IIA79_05850 [bacterium]|nr:hypothetical protein [bacterium]